VTRKKLSLVFTIFIVLALLSPSLAFATGGGPTPAVDAKAYAYADVGQIQILTSGLNEINHDMTFTFIVPFNSYAESGAYAQSGKGWLTAAEAGAYAYADGWAWGTVTKPDGSLAYWFDTGIVSNQDYDFDAEFHIGKPSDAAAYAYAEFKDVMIVTTTINLDQIGDWEAYLGADTLAKAFAEAGYIMVCYKCSSDGDCAWAEDYDLAELLKIFHVFDSPQLPSLKLWAHADGVAMEYYRVTNLIDPWNVKSLSQGPIEYVVPYDASLAGNGWWTHTQRGVYFLQPWNPTDGHSAKLFGIVAYLSKATGVEVHLWADGDFVWTNGAIIFAPSSVAESIQGRYETLGRNPGEEELGNVLMALLYLPKEAYPAYLATIE